MYSPPVATKSKDGPDQRSSSAPQHSNLAARRSFGNQATSRLLAHPSLNSAYESPAALLQRHAIQAKLQIGSINHPLEHEADRIADQVMRSPKPRLTISAAPAAVNRKCSACEKEEKEEQLQRKPSGASLSSGRTAGPIVNDVLRSPGQPLDTATRQFFEPRFGRDFSQVRIHTGHTADASARSVGALAYTHGSHIAFASGQYSPTTASGKTLLAHELAHTVQQGFSSESAHVIRRQPAPAATPATPAVAEQVLESDTLDGFDLNSATPKPEHKRRIIAIAKKLTQLIRDNSQGTVEVTGHTDATGGEALNHQLGQDRADAIAALFRRAGVRPLNIFAQSAGESELLVQTEKAEPRNRRVEVRFKTAAALPSQPASQSTTDSGKGPGISCADHPETCENHAQPEPEPACSSTNCSAISVDPYEKQPPDLRRVLDKSFGATAASWFAKLDSERRFALTQIFNRLCGFGLWCKVRLVTKIDAGEAPLKLAGHKFPVPGSTPSVFFTATSGDALLNALRGTGKFCTATGAGGSQHPGQTSLRQVSGSDSLHISLGGSDTLDAHIDHYSPVIDPPGSFECPNDPTPAAVGHIGKELVPDIVRSILPGFQVFPDSPSTVPQPPGTVGTDLPPSVVGVTIHGPLPNPKKPLVSPGSKGPNPAVAALDAKVIKAITADLQQNIREDELVPSRVQQRVKGTKDSSEKAGPDEEKKKQTAADEAQEELGNYDPLEVELNLAARLEQASIKNESTMHLDLGKPYGNLGERERKLIAATLLKAALIARKYLPSHGEGVSYILISFGSGKTAESEEVDLPQ